MKYLLYADIVVLILAAVMTVTLGVVCLLFALYSGTAPEVARGLPGLIRVTLAFVVLAAAAAAASWGVVRRRRLWPALQGLLLLSLPLVVALIRTGLNSGG